VDLGEERLAELRASGWSETEIRDYRRGYESAAAIASKPITTIPAPQLPSFTEAHAPRVLAGGDRGTWARSTVAGMVASVVSPDQPDEPARELAAAREFIDDWEYRYGRRPTMAEARLAVGRRTDGAVIRGTAADVGRVFATAGLPFAILSEVQPLPPPGAVIHQPVVRG
jgi:hypothetical protein